MKNRVFMALQLFADGGVESEGKEGSGGVVTGAENPGGDSKSEEDGTDEKEGDGKDPKKTPKYTDDDFDRMFNQKFAKLMEKHQKELDEAKRLTEMNAQEKAEYENKKLQEQVQQLMKKEAIAEMSKSARAMLSEKDINIGDDLLSVLVSDDADKTKKTVENFINLFQNAVNRAVKDALKGETPKTGGASGLTKEQIMKVKNARERQRLIAENMNLFIGSRNRELPDQIHRPDEP